MLTTLSLYAAVGTVAGILAGLLGIGGGLVIVPMLIFAFGLQKIAPELIMHLALGTSLASIIFTSISSFRAHHKKGAVRWDVVKRITPGILLGTFLGSFLAALLPTGALKAIFVVFLYHVATQMLRNIKPPKARQLPGTVGLFGAGNIIGAFSSLVGIGGGSLSVPFLTWCNISVHHAIGTASAIGLPIALAGAFGYVVNGLGAPNLPPYALGYVHGIALLGIISFSVLTAPLGAKLAHALPVKKLKQIFALLLYVVATRMLLTLF